MKKKSEYELSLDLIIKVIITPLKLHLQKPVGHVIISVIWLLFNDIL